MASFTETASLRVNDQSSAAIRRINAELAKLAATAKSLKSVTASIKVTDVGISKAASDIRRLTGDLGKLKSTAAVNHQ